MALLGAIFVPAVSAEEENEISKSQIDKYIVSESDAFINAEGFFYEYVYTGMGSEEPDKWKNAYVSRNPIKVYDANQKLLYYRFDIIKNSQVIGNILASGNKLIEKTILRFEDELNPYSKKLKEMEKEFGKSDMPLIIGYHAFGLAKLIENEKEVYVEDIVTGEDIKIDNTINIFDQFEEKSILSRVSNWDQEFAYFNKMDKEDFIQISKTETKSWSNWCHLEGISMVLQPSGSEWCGVATAKMAAYYYGKDHSGSHILDVMDINFPSESASDNDIVDYMRYDVGVSSCVLPYSWDCNYQSYKNEIGTRGNPDDPVLESITWISNGKTHSRLITGWYETSQNPRYYVYVHCPSEGPGLEPFYGNDDIFSRVYYGTLEK
ncbi:MAG: hypothetical protein PHV39_07045 [Methanomicrobium sp.]|nr:hypothetical protein [Methanomicrobium sp.]